MIQSAPRRRGQSGSARIRLYRLGAACGLLAVGFAVAQVIIEIIGVGIRGIPVPQSVEGWFSLIQDDRLLGLTELTGLQIPMFALLVPLYLALHAAQRRTDVAVVSVATVIAMIGIGVYLASNTALSMLTLSDQWAGTPTDEREVFVAAGQAMLAIYDGPGLDAGVFLVMAATLVHSVVMLRGGTFGRSTAFVGVTASITSLVYFGAVFVPAARIFILEAAGLFFVLWIALASRRLAASNLA